MKTKVAFLSSFIFILLVSSHLGMVESRRVSSLNYFTKYSRHEFYRSPPAVAVVGDDDDDDGDEIDPRYGVEKRTVPTGPNPLHH